MAKLSWLKNVTRHEQTVLTVGTFDGVHKGHQVLIRSVLEKAKQQSARSVIVTFDPHPRDIINPGATGIRLLSTLEERCEMLADLGVDEMVVIPFDRDFSLLSSETFVKDIIWSKIGVSEFVIGYDHQFGKDREGTIETVQRLGSELNFKAHVVSKQEIDNETVSSTAIRKALEEEGDVQKAASFLGRNYLLHGTVVHGDKRGKKLGYPTANIQVQHQRKIIPKDGVYAVWCRINGDFHGGMMNIGNRPTFDGQSQTLEVHLFDLDANLYGNEIHVQFLQRIRGEQAFNGAEALKQQLARDEKEAREILSKKEPNIAKQRK